MQKCDKIYLKPCKSVIKTFKILVKMWFYLITIIKVYNITKNDFPLKVYNEKILNIPLFLIEYIENFII